MRPALLAVLAIAVGASLWVASQEGDDVEPVRHGARGDRSDAGRQADGPSPSSGRRTSQAPRAKADASGQSADWARQALADGAARWSLRLQTGAAQPLGGQPAPSAWQALSPPAPPPAPVAEIRQAEAEPPAQAPPFPHKWIGRFIDEAADGGQTREPATPAAPVRRAIVAGPASTWVLREGDVIEGQWRVDKIGDQTLALTYLPLHQPQTVAMKSQ